MIGSGASCNRADVSLKICRGGTSAKVEFLRSTKRELDYFVVVGPLRVTVHQSNTRTLVAMATIRAMSIYRGWRPLLDDVQQQDVSHKEMASYARDITTPPPTHLRRGQPVAVLLPRTANWIASLPERVRPDALAKQFARISNLICATWVDPPACRKYFDELLVETRLRRKGFPAAVLRELTDLQAYYISMHDAHRHA